jgi:uncharacterized protein YbcI
MTGLQDAREDGGSVSAAVSTAVVHLIHEYTGRGPTEARAHFSDDLITIVLRDTLTKGERSLVRDGLSNMVLVTRKAYQGTMRDELVAAVERITGRTVAAFMSDNHLDPDMAIEAFVLEPVEASRGPG